MILKGALAGYRLVEVPVSYYPRIGKSKIGGTLKGTLGAAWFILSLIVSYSFRPRKAGVTASVGPGETFMTSSKQTMVRSSGSDRVLVIMAKAPRPSVVKTRLTSNLSPEEVTAFYCCLLDDTLALIQCSVEGAKSTG